MAKTKYNIHLKGYVGGWDFDSDYVDFVLNKNTDKEVTVLIDSLGGQLNTALSISSAFRRHGNVRVHFVGMNASAAAIACKKKSADLLALMKVGGWLTAEGALAWGFVDELTDFEDESAPVLTDALAADFTAHGIPLPKMLD